MAAFRATRKEEGAAEGAVRISEILLELKQLTDKRLEIEEKSYRVAQIKKNITRTRFENDLVKLRWEVWENYIRRIFFLLDVVNGTTSPVSAETNSLIDTIIVTDQLKWTFDNPKLHERADIILGFIVKLGLNEDGGKSLVENTDLIRHYLDEMDRAIAPLMKVKTGLTAENH